MSSTKQFTLLIADDSGFSRKLVQSTLAEHYVTIVAGGGTEAVSLFVEHRPDLVITDWMMPDMSGAEVCKRIRESENDSYTYVIILTSVANKSEISLGLSCGADDYLTKPFSPAELRARLKVGCRLIGFQREMREKNRQLEELAYTDPLTGLPNRRAIEVWAQSQIAAAIRHKFPLCVAMADLDRFKRLNDTFGHGSGDTVLRRFAKILKENCRSSSLYGRVGGEEFLIVMTHTNLAGAAVAIEHIRERFAEQVFSFGAHDVVATASFGVACHSGGSQTFRELVSRADAALYSAKQSGRNRIGFD